MPTGYLNLSEAALGQIHFFFFVVVRCLQFYLGVTKVSQKSRYTASSALQTYRLDWKLFRGISQEPYNHKLDDSQKWSVQGLINGEKCSFSK